MQTETVQKHEMPLEPIGRNLRARRDSMALIRVDCRVDNQTIPGGAMLARGVNECHVYESDLPIVEAMLETEPELVANAQRIHDRQIEAAIKKETEGLDRGPAREALERRVRSEFPGSPEATFFALNAREIKPLRALEVVKRSIPALAEQQAQEASLATARVLGEVLGEQLNKAMAAAANNAARAATPASGDDKNTKRG